MEWELSFRPYLSFLEESIQEQDNAVFKAHLETIAALFKKHPELLEPVKDWDILEQHREVIDLIRLDYISGAIPGDKPYFAMGIPNPMRFFSYTEEFKSLLVDNCGSLRNCVHSKFIQKEERYRRMYALVLEQCYGIKPGNFSFSAATDPYMRLRDDGGATCKYYRFLVNSRFIRIKCKAGQLPELRQEWIDYANGRISGYEELDEALPFDLFAAEGFIIFIVKDVTEEEALQELRKTIADMHTLPEEETFSNLRNATLSLLGDQTLQLGLLPFVSINNHYKYHPAFNYVSIIFNLMSRQFDEEILSSTFHNLLKLYIEKKSADRLIYNNLSESSDENEIGELTYKYGLQSMGIFPVWNQSALLGIVELASKKPGAIGEDVVRKMEQALPLYREFLTYQLHKLDDRINAYIMQRYTALQPAVLWKFNEAAWEALSEQKKKKEESYIPPKAVRFEQLSPFYGAVDVRNSSLLRLDAVQHDLRLQLEKLEALLDKADGLPETTAVKKEVLHWRRLIKPGISLEEETDLRSFLEESVVFIRELRKKGGIPAGEALEYENKMADESGEFHRASWRFEKSLALLNEGLKETLEQAEQSLQESVPHYFEKFKTDGWEFNLYAGQSIAPEQDFSADMLQVIREWQLNTMVDMAVKAHAIKPELPLPLETTQLTLVHGNPVTISYRTDERRFDVEGAYSIRYEVIKKRIDKALILDTGERLTQPGRIAIVYVHRRDAVYYRRQLQQLIEEGRLLPDIEQLELEKLQGVEGLKALRVQVNLQ